MPNNYHVNIYPLAYKDLEEIFKYISLNLGNPIAANAFIELFEERISSLSRFPAMYSYLDNEFIHQNMFRKMMIKNYAVIYRIVDEEIQILRVFNSRRNYIEDI